MKFRHKEFVDKDREKLVKRYIVTIVLVTMCPAIYLTYGIVKETFYQSSANSFISNELQLPDSQILSSEISYHNREIKVVTIGKEITEEQLALANSKLEKYSLKGTTLKVIQGMNNGDMDISNIKTLVLEDLYKRNEEKIATQQNKIDSLNTVLDVYTRVGQADDQLAGEIKALFGNISSVALSRSIRINTEDLTSDTLTYVILQCDKTLSNDEKRRVSNWLQTRTGAKKLRLIVD